jgi:hypothetical protein
MELSGGSLVLQLCSIAQIACLDIETNVSQHLRPPVISRYHFEGLKTACMSGNARIVMLLHDSTPQISVFGDINLASEHE